MILKSLRTSITVNVAFLLLLSMLLINIVMFIVVQKILVKAEITKGRATLQMLEELAYARMAANGKQAGDSLWIETLQPVIKRADVFCLVIVGADRRYLEYGEQCPQKKELLRLAERVAAKGGGADFNPLLNP